MNRRKPRATKVLEVSTIEDDALKDASKHNTDICPFLSILSPEIRNRIYKHVFGDVHVIAKDSYAMTKFEHRVCKAVTRELQTGHYEDDHSQCGPKSNDERLPLALLQTCRQIHDEAALIPYAAAKYIVDAQVLRAFMRNTVKAHRAAIKDVTLAIRNPLWDAGFGPEWDVEYIDEAAAKSLTGVERLQLVVFGGYIGPTYQHLARLPLKSVDISLHMSHRYLRSPRSAADMQSVADKLKVELMRPWEDIEQEQKQAAEAAAAARLQARRSSRVTPSEDLRKQKQAREAASAAVDKVQGTTIERRRAGQLRRGLNKLA